MRGEVLDIMTVQINVPRFCTRWICGWNQFQPLRLLLLIVFALQSNGFQFYSSIIILKLVCMNYIWNRIVFILCLSCVYLELRLAYAYIIDCLHNHNIDMHTDPSPQRSLYTIWSTTRHAHSRWRDCFNPYRAGVDFRRHNLTSVDVRFCRLKSIPVV